MIAHEAEHRLMHALPRLTEAVIHVQPAGAQAEAAHRLVRHHRETTVPGPPDA